MFMCCTMTSSEPMQDKENKIMEKHSPLYWIILKYNLWTKNQITQPAQCIWLLVFLEYKKRIASPIYGCRPIPLSLNTEPHTCASPGLDKTDSPNAFVQDVRVNGGEGSLYKTDHFFFNVHNCIMCFILPFTHQHAPHSTHFICPHSVLTHCCGCLIHS